MVATAAADLAQRGEVHHQPPRGRHGEVIGQQLETGEFARLGALPVVRVEQGKVVGFQSQGGGDRGVHAAGEAHHGQRAGRIHIAAATAEAGAAPRTRLSRSNFARAQLK